MARPIRQPAGLDHPLQKPLEIGPSVLGDMQMLGDHARLHRPIARRADEIENLAFKIGMGHVGLHAEGHEP